MFLQGTTQTAGVSSQSKDPKADFMKVFSQMGHTGTTLQSQLHDSGSGKQPDQGTGAVGSYDRYQYRENGIVKKTLPSVMRMIRFLRSLSSFRRT